MNRLQFLSLRHPALRLALLAIAIGTFAFLSIRVTRHQVRSVTGDGDWGVYYRAGAAMRCRQPIYTLDYGKMLTFKNAPAIALMLAPLSALPIGLARWLWMVGDLACLGITYRLAGRVIFNEATPLIVRRWLIAGALFLSAPYIFDELFSGPNAMLVLATMTAAFVWAWEGKGLRAGATLALGIALKIVPIALIPWLLFCRGKIRSIPALLLSLAALALLPALWIGSSANLHLLRQWPRHLAATEIHQQEWRVQNQSLTAMLTRYLSNYPPRIAVADLSDRSIKMLWLSISGVLAAALYLWIFRERIRGRLDAGAALSLLLLFITLCNPLAWRYNYVALGIPFLYVLNSCWKGLSRLKLVVALTELAFLLHFGDELMQGLSARFWGGVLLSIAVIVCWQDRTTIASQPQTVSDAGADPGSATISWQPAE